MIEYPFPIANIINRYDAVQFAVYIPANNFRIPVNRIDMEVIDITQLPNDNQFLIGREA